MLSKSFFIAEPIDTKKDAVEIHIIADSLLQRIPLVKHIPCLQRIHEKIQTTPKEIEDTLTMYDTNNENFPSRLFAIISDDHAIQIDPEYGRQHRIKELGPKFASRGVSPQDGVDILERYFPFTAEAILSWDYPERVATQTIYKKPYHSTFIIDKNLTEKFIWAIDKATDRTMQLRFDEKEGYVVLNRKGGIVQGKRVQLVHTSPVDEE